MEVGVEPAAAISFCDQDVASGGCTDALSHLTSIVADAGGSQHSATLLCNESTGPGALSTPDVVATADPCMSVLRVRPGTVDATADTAGAGGDLHKLAEMAGSVKRR